MASNLAAAAAGVVVGAAAAALAGALVLGAGPGLGPAPPDAEVGFEYLDGPTDVVVVVHRGGDPLDPGTVSAEVEDAANATSGEPLEYAGAQPQGEMRENSTFAVDDAAALWAGHSREVNVDLSGATVRLVWESGGEAEVLAEWSVDDF
jgi:hypothetical protein